MPNEEDKNIKQPGAHAAASSGLQQRNAFCALSFFEGAIKRLDVAIASRFRPKLLNCTEIMLGLRPSKGWRVEQQSNRITEFFEAVVFKELDLQIIFEGHLTNF